MPERDWHTIRRDGKQLAPGVFALGEELHVDLPVFIRSAGGDPSNPADQLLAMEALARVAREEEIPMDFVEEDRLN